MGGAGAEGIVQMKNGGASPASGPTRGRGRDSPSPTTECMPPRGFQSWRPSVTSCRSSVSHCEAAGRQRPAGLDGSLCPYASNQRRRLGGAGAPERPASCMASGRPRKSRERSKDSEEGRQAWHGGRLWGAQRPIFSLQFPPWCPFCRTQKGACTLKRIFEIMGVFCLFSFKINRSASGLLEKG